MDKQKLNNEVILCRPAVRKARVAVVRKIIKKIRILKSCKNEAEKAKKLRKAEKLFKKVQTMKKLKDDEVTKFALRHITTDGFLKESSSSKDNALASLAKHKVIVEKVNVIREKMTNWETELPLMLDSLASKKLGKRIRNKKVRKPVEDIKTTKPTAESTCNKLPRIKNRKIVEIQKLSEKNDNLLHNDDLDSERVARKQVEGDDNSKTCDNNKKYVKMMGSDSNTNVKVEKIDDPFFIEKKVIAPKLFYDNKGMDLTENPKKMRFQKGGNNFIFNTRPFKSKMDLNKPNIKTTTVESKESQLHPSWAAKKIQLIKPFEGKKIKFSDE